MSKNATVNPTTQSEINTPETETSRINRFGQVKDTFTRGAQKVNQGVTTVGRSVSGFASDATKYTQENPGKALAIAIGSGIGIGILIGATRRRASFWNYY